MLHNNGGYGPNDTPINMGAPLNMSQINGLNMAHNFNNLAKMQQQPPQEPSIQYGVPHYPSFGHPSASMDPHLTSYSNYHPLTFQPDYMSQTVNSHHNSSIGNVQNGMMPMNLNVHNDQNNIMDYHNFEQKRASDAMSDNGTPYRKNLPLNIPQVHTKAFQKHFSDNNETLNNFSPPSQSCQDRIDYITQNLELMRAQELKAQQERSRRRSLENTVKLIENILINSTPKNKDNNRQKLICEHKDRSREHSIKDTITDLEDKSGILKEEEKVIEAETERKIKEVSEATAETKSEPDMDKLTDPDQESSDIEEDKKPVELMDTDSKTIAKTDIMIKVEPISSWTDTEFTTPFLRDPNGVAREDFFSKTIVDGETSVEEAQEAIKIGVISTSFFECPHCNILIKSPKRFLIHVKWHTFGLTNEKREEIARKKEMLRTMKREARKNERLNKKEVKDEEKADGKTFPCKDCDKVFCNKSSLRNHRQRFHVSPTRYCKICNKEVGSWLALRTHLGTHSTDAGYQCPECPKRFKYSHSLTKHRDTHREKTEACPDCPKKFGSKVLLKMHMKVHERAQRGTTFHCTYCGKGFFESYNLQVHERTHRNERPFSCDICNSTFGTNSSLNRHMKVSHSTAKPWLCSVCHRSFSSESIRDHHEQRYHGNPEDFKFICNQCPCRYLKQKDLRKHIYKAHPKGKRRKKDDDIPSKVSRQRRPHVLSS